jgi:flagellin-like protein
MSPKTYLSYLDNLHICPLTDMPLYWKLYIHRKNSILKIVVLVILLGYGIDLFLAMFDMQQQDDSGVSPVIGVILMVAVTVALGDVSDSPDATVQLEEESNSVTATVLRNENVQDFTIQLETASSGVQTRSLGGDAGATVTASGTSTSQSTETFNTDTAGDATDPLDNGEQIDVANDPITSIDGFAFDTNDDGTFDDSGLSASIAGGSDQLVQYDGSSKPSGGSTNPDFQIVYTYEDGGSVTIEKATVIANMPDGQSEVLTSTEVNN